MNFEFICNQVRNAATEAGHFIQGEGRKFKMEDVESKGIHDFVSYVDKTAERMLVETLGEIIPEAGFIAEEGTVKPNEHHLKWIIDPLDGTTNFIHRIPVYSISIALMEGNEIVLGLVYELNLKEYFYAWKNSPAFLDGKQIHVSNTPFVKDSLVATGFPYSDFNRMPAYLASLEYFLKNSHGARRLGSAAVDLAYVACGRFEAFYEYGLKSWDVAAGAFIVQQAGGKVTDFRGGPDFIFGKELVATNAALQREFMDIIQKYMV